MGGLPDAKIVYNDSNAYVCEWLRNLVANDHIANGSVIEGNIEELASESLRGASQFHAFAGIGVWSYALRLAGWPDDVPIWTGSCPCQPFSVAGKQKALDDDRHVWPEWFRLISEHRPPVIVGEQVASPAGRLWLSTVSTDLETLGYAVGAADLCAAGAGAPHIRQRLFFMAYADHKGPQGRLFGGDGADQRTVGSGGMAGIVADTEGQRFDRSEDSTGQTGRGCAEDGSPVSGFWADAEWIPCTDGKVRPVEPGTFPLVDGTAGRVGLLRAYGNAIVAPIAATFIRAVKEIL